MNRSAHRDDGLRRISTLTKWTAGGAIVLAGVFSAVVAKALPGRSATTGGTAQGPSVGTPATTTPANPTDNGGDPGSSFGDSGSQVPDTLAPPPQLPSRGGGGRSAVVSGGS